MGDLPQTKRLKIIDEIKAGELRLLIATDVAARGLDIEGLALVVNYDLPNEPENYVHRIGRTARAGKTGKAITLASEQDVYELPGIERYVGRKIPSETATGELLFEDKSEGKRIHTDYREEQDNTKGRSVKRRREQETHKPASKRITPAHRKNKDPERRKRRENTKEILSDTKLSELPMEERMAYYKQKYGQNEKKRARVGNRKYSHSQAARNSPPAENNIQENTPSSNVEKKGFFSKFLGIFRKEKDE